MSPEKTLELMQEQAKLVSDLLVLVKGMLQRISSLEDEVQELLRREDKIGTVQRLQS